MYGAPISDVFNEGTRFQAASFLKIISFEALWAVLRSYWINAYLGSPGVIAHDAGKNFVGLVCTINVNSRAISQTITPCLYDHYGKVPKH